jgi:Tol biopolymer transport system component
MAEKEEQKSYHNPKFIWVVLVGIVVLGAALLWGNGRFPTTPTTPSNRILYLGWEEGELINQLYIVNPTGGDSVRLTETPYGIVDYAVSPDGGQIAYSVINRDDSIGIWLMSDSGKKQKQLWACENALCTRPLWAADRRRLFVERRTLSKRGAPPDAPQLWWLDTHTGETLPVFADANQTAYGAQLSPDNEWLSYLIPEAQEIRITHLATGESITTSSQTGEPAVWQPDGKSLLLSDMWYQGESFSQHLLRIDLDSAELTNISGAETVTNDGRPVFSPDGEWIVFGRKKPQAPMGRQLWLMRSDGSEANSLTENADMHYNNPAWSANGRQIVVQGYLWTEPESLPALWLLDVETRELVEVVSPGIQPTWLP